MKFILFLLIATPALFGRVTATRLAPEASVWFEPNHGQVKGRTDFVGRIRGAFLYLTGSAVVYALPPAKVEHKAKMRQVTMTFVGARTGSTPIAEKATGGYSNYFTGKAEQDWHTGVPHYERVQFQDVYPGVDVVYYGVKGRTEFDLELRPGAALSQIGLRFTAADSVRLDAVGDLRVKLAEAEIRQHRPRVFQGGVELESWYEMEGDIVRIRVPQAISTEKLTIDPIVDFSTYLGGPGAEASGSMTMAMAPDGNLVHGSCTQSPASPVLDPFTQPTVVSLAPIIMKAASDGKRILFYTILGRNGWDCLTALALGKDASITVGGTTRSGEFPVRNAFQTQFKAIWDNAFVARLSADSRTLIYSSYMGGSNREQMNSMTLDDRGDAYFVGNTQSNDYPVLGALQPKAASSMDAFLTRITPEGKIVFSTYFGGSGLEGFADVKWRSDGLLILTGSTASADFPLKDPIETAVSPRTGFTNPFLVFISEDGANLIYSTFFGGRSVGWGSRLALVQDGRIFVAGGSSDRGYPLKNPLFGDSDGEKGFVTIFDRTGRDRLYSTLVPGMSIIGMALDDDGNIVLTGAAKSNDFPVKDSFQEYKGGGVSGTDGALLKLTPDGQALRFATIMGGSNGEWFSSVVIGKNQSIYVFGHAISTNFPVVNAYQPQAGGGNDSIFLRFTDNSPIPVTPSAFGVSPARLTFRFTQGEPVPPPLPLVISNLNGQVFAAPTVTWLRVSPAGLGVSGTIAVTVNPAGLAPGLHTGSIKLTPTTGEAATIDVGLTVLAAAPRLQQVEPPLVPVGADDTEITLRGSGFTSGTTVQLQTIPWLLSPVRFVDSTTLKLTLPKPYFSAEYNHSITVQNPDSAVSQPVSLTVGRPAPAIAPNGILSAASYAGDVISPGEILTLFGENFEPGMRVNFDGLLATPLYITPNQLSVVAPPGVAGAREANVIVERDFDWRSTPVRIPVWPARPGLFTADSSGKGPAAALNQDGSINSPANPATKGEIIVLYGTGGGVDNLPTKVFIDGMDCEVLYAGQAPGLIAGAWQLNVRIPLFATKGEVVWRAGERESPEGVHIALQE